MKFSIVTPEHNKDNLPFLLELYECIKEQTYENWEWVLYLNNGMHHSSIPKELIDDERCMVIQSSGDSDRIGDIKHNAFMCASGDVLVEVDHDDLITPDCLQELFNVYQDPSVGFVYSDNAVLHMTDEFVPYDSAWGWEQHEPFEWKGKKLHAMKSFEPSSQSVGYIWYAPDHVRSWRRDVYHSIGGHNKELSICDDHELVLRTYLATKMVRVPKVLYIYRITGANTWLARNEAIQTKTVELFQTYARSIAEKDARDKGLLCVDIGSGINPMPGYISVDLREDAHIKWDLENGLPFGDNTVGVLNASHIIEHLKDPIKTMSEIHRVLAHGGWAFIEVPSTDGRGAFQDPTHVSYWNENSFLYYTNRNLAQYIGNDKIRFQEYRRDTTFPNEWMRSINVCVTSAWLVALKDGPRFPGPLNI